MVIMNLKLDNIYSFSNFEIDFSYPKKIVNSLIEDEHISGFPNFRYKKVNIIMGANATGKTTLGLAITNLLSYLYSENIGFIEAMINDRSMDASICLDMVDDGKHLRRILVEISGAGNSMCSIMERTRLSFGTEKIAERDSYQSCLKRLLKRGLSDDPQKEMMYAGWAMVCSNSACTIPEGLDRNVLLKVFNTVLRTLDPSIDEIREIPDARNSYIIKKNGQDLIFQDGQLLKPLLFSSGTREGISLSYLIAGILTHTFQTYYCDEKFSFVHSYIEKRIFGIMMSHLGENEQLIFTTHNEEMLELNLPKHSYTFLVRKHDGDRFHTEAIYANDYVRKYSDNLKTAIENDVIKALPEDDLLDSLEEF